MKTIKTSLILCCLFFISACAFGQKTIQEIEAKRFLSMTTADTNYLKFILSEDLVYCHSNGLEESKAEFIKSISTKNIVYKTIIVKEQHIRKYKKTIVINGIVHVSGSIKNSDFNVLLKYTDIYVKKKGWKLVGWQSTKL